MRTPTIDFTLHPETLVWASRIAAAAFAYGFDTRAVADRLRSEATKMERCLVSVEPRRDESRALAQPQQVWPEVIDIEAPKHSH